MVDAFCDLEPAYRAIRRGYASSGRSYPPQHRIPQPSEQHLRVRDLDDDAGLLLHLGTLPFSESFRRRAVTQAVLRGINAGVVGLLGGALYEPIWTSEVRAPQDFAVALVGFILLVAWKAPPVVVVVASALGGAAFALR